MSAHVPWASIEAFHNIRKHAAEHPPILGGNPVVTYRAKVKLHGTNAGIRLDADGTVTAFSRNRVITPADDNLAFAAWVAERADEWRTLGRPLSLMGTGSHIVYGEFFGPGIMAGVACCKVPARQFAVFASRQIFSHGDTFFGDPDTLADFAQIRDTHVLPWFAPGGSPEEYTVDFNADWSDPVEAGERVANQCAALNRLNDHVEAVEACDPWVRDSFGIEGIGEGLVLYPVSHPGYQAFCDLGFKAKGKLHRGIKADKPAARDPEKAADAGAFAALVVTPSRLEQGVREVSGGVLDFDLRKTGAFLSWMAGDVQKECGAEMVAAGLSWADVSKPVSYAARSWYLAKAGA